MARNTSKSDNKSKPEEVKAVKTLSPKKQIEVDHQAGKHKEVMNSACGFCNRRVVRDMNKTEATKRFFAGQKK